MSWQLGERRGGTRSMCLYSALTDFANTLPAKLCALSLALCLLPPCLLALCPCSSCVCAESAPPLDIWLCATEKCPHKLNPGQLWSWHRQCFCNTFLSRTEQNSCKLGTLQCKSKQRWTHTAVQEMEWTYTAPLFTLAQTESALYRPIISQHQQTRPGILAAFCSGRLFRVSRLCTAETMWISTKSLQWILATSLLSRQTLYLKDHTLIWN